MKTKMIFHIYFWIIFVTAMVACNASTPNTMPTQDIGTNINSTQVSMLTNTPATTKTRTPTATKTRVATRTPLPFVALDGLRVTYTFKGNVYVQDSGKQPVQLTHSGKDYLPILSDDGQKIFFYRSDDHKTNPIYKINADGSQEQALVTNSLLITLNRGYEKSTKPYDWNFVPQTHQLLFTTGNLNPMVGDLPTEHSSVVPNQDLLIVDTDNAKIRQILPPGKVSYFDMSPNGKLIWILSEDHLDVIGLDGKTKYQIADYPPLSPERDFAKPDMYWTQDSRRLTLAMPPAKGYMDYALPYFRTLWQYSPFDNSSGTEIQLSPPPIDQDFSISPDGNWIIYSYYYIDGKNEPTDKFGVYFGNLRKGTSQFLNLPALNPYSLEGLSFSWSPDSRHFIVGDTGPGPESLFIGDIDGQIIHRTNSRSARWIDNDRYLYNDGSMGEISNDSAVRVAEIPRDIPSQPPYFAFVFLGH